MSTLFLSQCGCVSGPGMEGCPVQSESLLVPDLPREALPPATLNWNNWVGQ